MSTTIYHNPRCSKSRETLALLRQQGIEPSVVEYLKQPPSNNELQAILKQLGISPRELLRKGESDYKELKLSDTTLSDQQLVSAMVSHPTLIERPIVIHNNKAALGRPPENILEILK